MSTKYQKIRELAEDYIDKGICVDEIWKRIREKFGDEIPTTRTIYKWRREFLDRKVF